MAAASLRRERRDHTLGPTALVHEAFLRLVRQRRASWRDRTHFLSVSATLMRRILVDHARRRQGLKRGGDLHRVPRPPAPQVLGQTLGRAVAVARPPRQRGGQDGLQVPLEIPPELGRGAAPVAGHLTGGPPGRATGKPGDGRSAPSTGLPVRARAATLGYRARKFLRRRAVATGAAAVLLAVVLGFAALTWVQQERVEREQEQTAQVAEFLVRLCDRPSFGGEVSARQLLERGGERLDSLEQRSLLDSSVRARLLAALGRAYGSLGLYREAVPRLEEALALHRELLGEVDPTVAADLRHLVRARYQAGKLEAALGPDHRQPHGPAPGGARCAAPRARPAGGSPTAAGAGSPVVAGATGLRLPPHTPGATASGAVGGRSMIGGCCRML